MWNAVGVLVTATTVAPARSPRRLDRGQGRDRGVDGPASRLHGCADGADQDDRRDDGESGGDAGATGVRAPRTRDG